MLNRNNFERRKNQLVARADEYSQLLLQKVSPPQVALVGAFHGTNTGDNTLGLAVKNLVNQQGLTAGLQNFSTLSRWPQCQYTVCAGGATGVEKNLSILAARNYSNHANTALIGMDFSSDIAQLPERILTFLSTVSYISCRSRRQASHLASTLNSGNIHFHLDNAFTYPFVGENDTSSLAANEKVLGFNCLPFFMYWIKRKGFVPGHLGEAWYRKAGSNIVKYIDLLGPRYVEFINQVLDVYLQRGWTIVHIPFSPEDDLFARTFFKQLQISFHSFSPSPQYLFRAIQKCGLFLSTRFHALTFALIANVPCVPFLYSVKCRDLLDDLQVDCINAIDRMELIHSFSGAVEKATNAVPIQLSFDAIHQLSYQTSAAISDAIESLIAV